MITARDILRGLNKTQTRNVGIRLGLSPITLMDRFADSSVEDYCYGMLQDWINERDSVLAKGGAKWENLRRALQEEGLHGHARKV